MAGLSRRNSTDSRRIQLIQSSRVDESDVSQALRRLATLSIILRRDMVDLGAGSMPWLLAIKEAAPPPRASSGTGKLDESAEERWGVDADIHAEDLVMELSSDAARTGGFMAWFLSRQATRVSYWEWWMEQVSRVR